jgi:hypothetical protein
MTREDNPCTRAPVRRMGVPQWEGISPAAAVVQGILGDELMRGILANQHKTEEGGGHHEVFNRPYVSPPYRCAGADHDFSTARFALRLIANLALAGLMSMA